MELRHHPKNMLSLGFGHWGGINVVIKDIFKLKINTPFNQFNKKGQKTKTSRRA